MLKIDFLYIPFAKLTLKDIGRGVIPILMLLLCFTWLFDKSKDSGMDDKEWGLIGILIVVLFMLIFSFVVLFRG